MFKPQRSQRKKSVGCRPRSHYTILLNHAVFRPKSQPSKGSIPAISKFTRQHAADAEADKLFWNGSKSNRVTSRGAAVLRVQIPASAAQDIGARNHHAAEFAFSMSLAQFSPPGRFKTVVSPVFGVLFADFPTASPPCLPSPSVASNLQTVCAAAAAAAATRNVAAKSLFIRSSF